MSDFLGITDEVLDKAAASVRAFFEAEDERWSKFDRGLRILDDAMALVADGFRLAYEVPLSKLREAEA